MWPPQMRRIPRPVKVLRFLAVSVGFHEICAFFAVRVDGDFATLQPFGEFLYRGPPCASKVSLLRRIHAYVTVKLDVDVATLRLFGYFLYCGPPCASKVSLLKRIYHILQSNWMSMSPFCSFSATFYTAVRLERQKFAS